MSNATEPAASQRSSSMHNVSPAAEAPERTVSPPSKAVTVPKVRDLEGDSAVLLGSVPAGAALPHLWDTCKRLGELQDLCIIEDGGQAVLMFPDHASAASFLDQAKTEPTLGGFHYPDSNRLFATNLPSSTTAAQVESWISQPQHKLVRRPGVVPQDASVPFTSASLLFPNPDAGARAMAYAARRQPAWAAEGKVVCLTDIDPEAPPPSPKSPTAVQPDAAKTKGTKVDSSGGNASRRKSTTDADRGKDSIKSEAAKRGADRQGRKQRDAKIPESQLAKQTQLSKRDARIPESQLAKQTQLLSSITEMMKSMTTKERLEKTHDAERQASSMTLVSEPAASAVPLSQASGTWAMQLPGLVPLQPRPTLLAVEPVAQDITLAFGTSHCVTRMLRIVDPLGASSTAPVALGSVGDRDILRLGSIRLDLLLFHLGDPIVLGVEFVTFSPQPAEVARAMLAAMRAGPAIGGGVDCRHAGQPVCLIVVPAALKWFRQIRATFPHLIRHAIDLDEALGDGAAWGMLIVERASAL